MTEPRFEPRIVGFFCNWCSYRAADAAGSARYAYPANLRIVRLMCSGRIDPAFVLKALSLGADGVLIAGCHPGECHYIEQNYKTLRRHALLRHTLRQFGVEDERVRLVWASAAEGQKIVEEITGMVEDIRRLGPLEWRSNWTENSGRLEALERIAEEHAGATEVRP